MLFSSAALVLLGAVVERAAGWGNLGHRTIAYIAYKHLKPSTAQYLEKILSNSQGYDISDAATWADTVRRGRPETAPWHFIDAHDSPPHQCGVKYPADCGDKPTDGCVISAISNQTSLFLSTAKSTTEPDVTTHREALMFILHFIGDLHQPLHCEDEMRGGNEIKVCFAQACASNNLHSVWDKYIPHKINGLKNDATNADEKKAAQIWAAQLYKAQVETGVSIAAECTNLASPDRCSLIWATESNAYNCQYVLKQSIQWLESNDLSLSYYDGAKDIVSSQIGSAGVRLAAWLEAIVAASSKVEGADGHQIVLGGWEL